MPDAEMKKIYRTEYWDRVSGDVLRAGEDLCVFDFAVNSGPARACDVWKRCGGGKRQAADIIDAICAYRLSFLRALRTWSAFGKGWGRRVAACEAAALRTWQVYRSKASLIVPRGRGTTTERLARLSLGPGPPGLSLRPLMRPHG